MSRGPPILRPDLIEPTDSPSRRGHEPPRPGLSRVAVAVIAVAALFGALVVAGGWSRTGDGSTPTPSVTPPPLAADPTLPPRPLPDEPVEVAPLTFPEEPFTMSTALGPVTWSEFELKSPPLPDPRPRVMTGWSSSNPVFDGQRHALVTRRDDRLYLWSFFDVGRRGPAFSSSSHLLPDDVFPPGSQVDTLAATETGLVAAGSDDLGNLAIWRNDGDPWRWTRISLPLLARSEVDWFQWAWQGPHITPSPGGGTLLIGGIWFGGVDWSSALGIFAEEWRPEDTTLHAIDRGQVVASFEVSAAAGSGEVHLTVHNDSGALVIDERIPVPEGAEQWLTERLRFPGDPRAVSRVYAYRLDDEAVILGPARLPGGEGASIHGLAASPDVLVAVGSEDGAATSRPRVWRSTDGVTWQDAGDGLGTGSGGTVRQVAYGDGRFHVLGSARATVVTSSGITARTYAPVMWSSPDGALWTRVDGFAAAPQSSFLDLRHGPLGWAVVGRSCGDGFECLIEVRVSADGTNWDAVRLGEEFEGVNWRNERGLSVGSHSLIVAIELWGENGPQAPVVWIGELGSAEGSATP